MINRSALLAGLLVRVDAVNLEAGWVSVERDEDGDVLMHAPLPKERPTPRRRLLVTSLPCYIDAGDIDSLGIPWRMAC